MTTFLTHTWNLTIRNVRMIWRTPVFLAMNIIQPLMWLFLFGQLFKNVVDMPGFAFEGSYLEFMVPGTIMMTALFGSAWAGDTYIQDMGRGVMDRLLTSPTNRGAMMIATTIYQILSSGLQAIIVFVIAWLAGARFDGGEPGALMTLLAMSLMVAIFSALSNAIALVTQVHEALIGISQLITMPLMFLSSAIMNTQVSASWIKTGAKFNPFDWAVRISRECLAGSPDWGNVWLHIGLLAVVAVVMTSIATRAFTSYLRSQ